MHGNKDVFLTIPAKLVPLRGENSQKWSWKSNAVLF